MPVPSVPRLALRHGIDLVEVERIARMRAEHGDHFLERIFTDDERAYAMASAKRADEHLAARFAAKEAAMKALGLGLRDGLNWTDLEVARDGLGAPFLVLHAKAAERAERLGVSSWTLSLSHTDTHAVASAVGLVVGPGVGQVAGPVVGSGGSPSQAERSS